MAGLAWGGVVMRRAELATARKAAGYTQESLAAALNVDRSTVIRWEAGDYAPLPYLRPKLARLLRHTPEQLRALIDGDPVSDRDTLSPDVEAACTWLDERLNWKPGTSARRVTARLPKTRRELPTRQARRDRVSRTDVVAALRAYYGSDPDYSLYTARFGGQALETSILTRPDWLDLHIPLNETTDALALAPTTSEPTADPVPAAALERLAEVEAAGVRLTNEQTYRLLDVDIRASAIRGTVGVAPFLEYALTLDLLENELLDALADGQPVKTGSLPLRDKYLPSLASAVDLSSRLCAGGVLALSAIARSADTYGTADFALLVQERSHLVVNAARQLTVIPKGFHQPMTDVHADTSLRNSLLRELEEELFGRTELDNTVSAPRAALPMHLARLSKPMRSLLTTDGLRVECTGFGINLVSGNYEFGFLLTISNMDFWSQFGGHIEANWEARRLKIYTSSNTDFMTCPESMQSWNNEGFFAFTSGLDRLRSSKSIPSDD
ncbi:helix-turn-helix domain-containing protein [Amycolatopsis thermophila]|uniref:DNA-binding XRE family transcriptional regulator n=1 Tax=Amycolatopsis thermophila TaxID=206084 RepID=A0ABU0EUS6_9PSEU|nr:helix-turn-helix transcriptional regulator [Amycolatopsis thermophila]MDQ0379052.1 DNA-binding XRE family transcriptional regulator [Amycolatopsis thermophila]